MPRQPIKNNPRVLAPQGHQGNNSTWQLKHFRSSALRKLRVLAEVCRLSLCAISEQWGSRWSALHCRLLLIHSFLFWTPCAGPWPQKHQASPAWQDVTVGSVRPPWGCAPGSPNPDHCQMRLCARLMPRAPFTASSSSPLLASHCPCSGVEAVSPYLLQALTVQSHPSPQTAWWLLLSGTHPELCYIQSKSGSGGVDPLYLYKPFLPWGSSESRVFLEHFGHLRC